MKYQIVCNNRMYFTARRIEADLREAGCVVFLEVIHENAPGFIRVTEVVEGA